MGKIYIFLAIAFCSFGVAGYCIWADGAEHSSPFKPTDHINNSDYIQRVERFAVPEDTDILPYTQTSTAVPAAQASVTGNRKPKGITRIEVAIMLPDTRIPRVTIGNSILRQEFPETEGPSMEYSFTDITLLPFAFRNRDGGATVFIKYFYGSFSKPGT